MATKYYNIENINTLILERILQNLEKECNQAERWLLKLGEKEWIKFEEQYENLTFQCNEIFFELKKREVRDVKNN